MKIKSKTIFSMSISFKTFDLYLQKTTLFILLCSKAYDRKKSRLTAPYKTTCQIKQECKDVLSWGPHTFQMHYVYLRFLGIYLLQSSVDYTALTCFSHILLDVNLCPFVFHLLKARGHLTFLMSQLIYFM